MPMEVAPFSAGEAMSRRKKSITVESLEVLEMLPSAGCQHVDHVMHATPRFASHVASGCVVLKHSAGVFRLYVCGG
jgi:hypothetical protein